jgi:hypothetical protein
MATHPEDPRKPDPKKTQHEMNLDSSGKPIDPEQHPPVFQGPGSIDESDSAIQLGLPAGSDDVLSDSDLHPPVGESGINSGVAWAALMEEIPESTGNTDEIRIDSPSDADLLKESPPSDKLPPIGHEPTLVAPPAELSSFPPRRSGPPAPPPATDSAIGEEPFEARDIFTAEPTGRYPRPDTGVGNARESASSTPPSTDPGRVDLGAAVPQSPASAGIESSIIDLGAIDFPSGTSPSGSAVEEAELASESSGIDLTAEPVSGTGSGRDLIAEALESGIKFGAPPEPSDTGASALPGDAVIDFTGTPLGPKTPAPQPADSPFSSAIEFGGPGAKAPPPPPPPAAPKSPNSSAISSAIEYGGASSSEDSSSAVQLAPDMPDDVEPFEVRPPTLNPASGRPATLFPEAGRPPTLFQTGGRPKTEPSTSEEMEAMMRGGTGGGPADSEVDLGSQPSTPDVEAPASSKPAKTESDSDIDINIGQLPEGSGVGSGLFVNANSGRLEPTDAAIDLDAEAIPEEEIAAEEEPVTEQEEVEAAVAEAPAKKPRLQLSGTTVAWLGGGGIGLVGGLAAVFLLQMLGVIGGSSTPPAKQPPGVAQGTAPVVNPPVNTPPAVTAPAVSKFELLQNGDLDKAAQAGIEQVDVNDPEQLARRGEFYWLSYLQKQYATKGALKADDDAVKKAAADLQAAADKGNADALFWLGNLQESTNALEKAKETYAKGAKLQDKQQKRRFDAALLRLELREAAKAAGAARAPDAAEALLLALVALQAPAPAPAADIEEAGFDFWEAAKLARDQKYAEAVQTLDKARAAHDQRRFSRLRKAQNPLSDPTEEIFLRAADELKAYWQLEDKLRAGGYLDMAMRRDPVKAVDELMVMAKEGTAAKVQAEKLAKERDKLDADIAKLNSGLKEARDEAAAQTANAKAATEKISAETAKANVLESRLKAESMKLQSVEARERVLRTEKAAAENDLNKVVGALAEAKMMDARAGRAGVVAGVQSAIRLATASDSAGTSRAMMRELNESRILLQQRWTPGEMLNYWLPLLRERTREDLAEKALIDSARVVRDPKAQAPDKARAFAIEGLALRNLGKFAQASAALNRALPPLRSSTGEWRQNVEQGLKDVADPLAYYRGVAEELRSEGKMKEAVTVLERAEAALPANKAEIQTIRGLFFLDAARAKSERVPADDPALQQARKDITAAANSGNASAFYAAGQLAETTGDIDAAIASYRKAVAAHSARDVEGSRYRLALARALTRTSTAAVPGEAPKPAAKPGETTGRAKPALDAFVIAVMIGLQAPPAGNQSEAAQLADEVLQSPDSTPEMKAQALAIKGMYTQALLTYFDALRPSLTRDQIATLKQLVLDHPALRRPESQAVANPQSAERHYMIGLRLLYSGQYAAAEKELLTAISQDGEDARYYYFLGLARHYQGKKDALTDYEQAARLEQQGLPPREAIDSALERVQGTARRPIDSARGTPR